MFQAGKDKATKRWEILLQPVLPCYLNIFQNSLKAENSQGQEFANQTA